MIDDLKLPTVNGVPEMKPKRLPPLAFDRWVNENLGWLRQGGRLDRLRAQASRQPAARRFHL